MLSEESLPKHRQPGCSLGEIQVGWPWHWWVEESEGMGVGGA